MKILEKETRFAVVRLLFQLLLPGTNKQTSGTGFRQTISAKIREISIDQDP